MKNITYILLSLLLVFAGCRKADKVETYQIEVGETTVTAGTDNVGIEAAYTYDYTLKSALLQYSDNSGLENAVSLAAQFDNGVLKATATGLKPATTYFYRFELDNGMTKMWTETGTFRTLDEPIVTELVVTTAEVSSIADTYAVCGGEVVSEGGSKVIARGVCYGLSENPSLDNCTGKTVDGSGLGTFTSTMTGLEKETKYHVRAYATNNDTTCYGEQKIFTTLGQIVYTLPTVITNAVDETTVGQYSAMLSGVVTDDGNKPVTGCGFWYSTSHDTLGGITKPAAYSAGGFSLNVSDGIEPGTTYYARAYAENEIGRRLGNEVSFTTLSIPPTPDPQVFTLSSADVTTNSATIKGRVYYDGTENPIKKGFLYGTDINDMNSDIDCTSQPDPFEAALTGLTQNTTYYYKAYATFTGYAQTFYGGIESFRTLIEITEPTIQTVSPSNITTTTANSGGYGITDGNSPIIKKGVCWATFENPTLEDCLGHTENGTGTADFISEVTGLEPGTEYYVRAYAVNQAGMTGYGEPKGFKTMQQVSIPTVITSDITNITQTTATGGGNVTGDGGATVTARGICWSTSQNPTVSNSHTTDGTGTGTFTSSMTGLTANTTYYVRAYATNSAGTAYGEQKTFTTAQQIFLPTVITSDITNIAQTTATGGGNVTNDGGAVVTARGICWSTSQNPTVSNSHTTDGTGTGTFTSSMTGLTANTTYYVRAYATNSAGTAYGNPKTFTTAQEETGNYFCITALDAGTTTVSMAKEGDAPTVYLEYKKNNGTWTTFTVGSTNISLSQNDKVFFKAPDGKPNNKFANDFAKYNHFVIGGGNVDVSGNIMYLLDPTGNKITLTSANNYAFTHLFSGCKKLVSANQLSLPATTLADWCYADMFLNCTSLTTAPDLPATTLADGCYYNMFFGCTSLTTAPDLPATTLADGCYSRMFFGCTSLTTAPDLPATTLADSCYYCMFIICTSLTTAPDLPATTLADNCYYCMFSDCTSLTTAPDLPATTLAEGCYFQMFWHCPSLTTAPDLPATTLAEDCYGGMFGHCTSLTTAPDLPATTLADYCYGYMFSGCTSLTTAPDLPATTLADGCYSRMFSDCTSLTTAPDLPATTLADNCYGGMFSDCTSLTTAPDLPATTLASACYGYMFGGCSNLHYIRMLATENLNATTALDSWVSGVPSTGDFYKKVGANLPNGSSGIPSGWTVHNE